MIRGSLRVRLLVGGLLVSLGVMAADQFWGRGVRPAGAAQSVRAAAAAVVSSASGAAARQSDFDKGSRSTRPPLGPYASVAERLSAVQRDPFVPSPLIDALLHPAPPPADEPLPVQTEDPAENFRASHQLDGVVLGPEPLAVVDGQIVAVGAALDGWQLLRVERERVIFRRTNGRGELSLEVPPPRRAAPATASPP